MNTLLKHSTIIFFCLVGLSFTGCISDTGEEIVNLAYLQTYCADSWDLAVQDTQQEYSTEARVSDYLGELNIEFESLSISDVNPPEACLACSCLTGMVIYLTITNQEDEEILESIGFYTE